MKEETKKLFDKLPSSWNELTLKQYIKLGGTKIHSEIDDKDLSETVGMQNSLEVISLLTDTSIEKLEAMPMGELQVLGKKIDFISVLPVPDKQCKIAFKLPAEITYNDFVLYQTLSEDSYNNLPAIIQTFSKEELTDDSVLNLSMQEVFTGFFLQKKGVKKFIDHTIHTLKRKLLWMKFRSIVNAILCRKKWQMAINKYKNNSVGIG